MKKLFTTFSVLLFFALTVTAQHSKLWSDIYAPNLGIYNRTVDMKTDTFGNVYVTGTIGTSTNRDVVTKKIDKCGVELWSATYESGGDDIVVGMGMDNSGNVYVAGNYGSAPQNPLVVKYDNLGNQIWAKQVVITQGATIIAMTNDAAGNVYLAGSIPNSTTGDDAYVLKFNSAGTQMWSRSYDAGGATYKNEVINDIYLGGSSVYLTGYSKGAYSTTIPGWSKSDILTLKYTTTGTLSWANNYVSTYKDYGVKVRTDATGNVYVFAKDETNYSPTSFVYLAGWRLIKYNNAGAEVFNNVVTTAGVTFVNFTPVDMLLDPVSGDINLTGYTDDGLASPTFTAMYTIKYNSSGVYLHGSYYLNPEGTNTNGQGFTRGEKLLFDNSGNLVVFGIIRTTSTNYERGGFVVYNNSFAQIEVGFDILSTRPVSFVNSLGASISNNNDFYMGTKTNSTDKFTVSRFHEIPAGFQAHTYSTAYYCVGDSVQLMGYVPPGSTFSWSPTTGLSDPNSINPWASSIATYKLTLNECDGTSSVWVESRMKPTTWVRLKVNSNTLVIKSDTTIYTCNSDTLALAGYFGNNYIWLDQTNSSYADVTSDGQFTSQLNQSGTYYADVSNADCQVITPKVTIIISNGGITASASADTICRGESIILTATGGTSYSWTYGIPNGGSFTPSYTLNYTVTGTGNGCSTAASVKVYVNQLPTVVANATSTTVCSGNPVTLTGSGASSYIWNNGITNGVVANPTATTTYTVTGSDINNCQNTDQITVTVNQLPNVVANATSTTVCGGSAVTLSGSGASSYIWDNGVTNGIAINPTATATYTVTGTDVNNCQNTDQITVNVDNIDNTTSTLGATITANEVGATYQWIDCNNGNANISGEVAQSYTATVTGSYAVIVTKGSCIETSACENIIITGIETQVLDNSMNIYPNPTNGIFTVEMSNAININDLLIYDNLGRRVNFKLEEQHNSAVILDLSSNPKGIYFVQITSKNRVVKSKIILN